MTTITRKDYEQVAAEIQPDALAVVSVSTTVSVSRTTWLTPIQVVEVASTGASMDAGDAGEMAVRRFGKTLKKLADS